MQALITGGGGFIGSRLATVLNQSGWEVVLFDSFHPQVHGASRSTYADGIGVYPGDVRDAETWDRYFRRHGAPKVVVHLAAETGTGQSLTEATRHGSTNVVGTTQLTDALIRNGCVPEQLVLTSSRAVYGEGAWADETEIFYPLPRSGDQLALGQWNPTSPTGRAARPLPHEAATTWPRPTNVYASTKLAQEHLLDSWCQAYGVPLTVLRLQNVYGPGQAVGNAYTGVLTYFARQIASSEQVEVYEDGEILRDFVYVDDVVDALARSIARTPAGTRRADIGGGGAVSLFSVASTMCELGGGAPPTINGKYRLGDVRAASADISQANTDLDWRPTTSLPSGLGALLEWVPDQL